MASLSVLILSYNHACYIEKAILSCKEQLEYFETIEVLIIDDGSDDNSKDVIENLVSFNSANFKIKPIYNSHEGVTAIAKNLNKLISLAKCDYISFLASDDAFLPLAFKEQLSMFKSDNAIQLIYADGYNIKNTLVDSLVNTDKTKKILSSCNVDVVLTHVLTEIPRIFIQSVIAKKSFFNEFKPFDEDLIADDWVFNINCFRKLKLDNLKFAYQDKPIFNRNILDGSTSKNFDVHFVRISQVANRYVMWNNKKFYFVFYLKFIRHFFHQKKYLKCFRLMSKIFLVITGSKSHLKGLL